MLQCAVCGDHYWPLSQRALHTDQNACCEDCHTRNFAGASPPFALDAPLAREILAAYVDSSHQMTPRQHEAMTRLAAVWRRQAEED